MFKHAIIRKVSTNFQNGLSLSQLGKPIYKKALLQHTNYSNALEKCGLKILSLKATAHRRNVPEIIF